MLLCALPGRRWYYYCGFLVLDLVAVMVDGKKNKRNNLMGQLAFIKVHARNDVLYSERKGFRLHSQRRLLGRESAHKMQGEEWATENISSLGI